MPDISGANCSLKICKGDVPSARRGHLSFCHDRFFYIFGGTSIDKDEDTSKLYSLSLDNFIWKKIETIGKIPTPRSYMIFNLYTNNRLLVFGG